MPRIDADIRLRERSEHLRVFGAYNPEAPDLRKRRERRDHNYIETRQQPENQDGCFFSDTMDAQPNQYTSTQGSLYVVCVWRHAVGEGLTPSIIFLNDENPRLRI